MNQTGKNSEKANAESLINALKSKDKKIRYKTLDTILQLSHSNKSRWKDCFLNLILSKSVSEDWEDRYVAIYAISRFYQKNWDFEKFKKQFLNAVKLIEDKDGRVRIAARNALEHFRLNFLYFSWGEWKVDKKKIVELWKESLYSLWEKIDATEEDKIKVHLVECIRILCQHYMDEYLTKKDFEKYLQIWNTVNELDERY